MPMQFDVVIPALNEEQNIGRVVHCFKMHSRVNNVFVMIDDATDDYTKEVAFEQGGECYRIAGVSGKGQLLQYGVSLTTTERIAFSDGDYTRFTANAVDYLSTVNEPMTMRLVVPRYPTYREWRTSGLNIPFDQSAWMANTGLRSFPRSLVIDEQWHIHPLHGYLTETQLNQRAKAMHYPIIPIYCPSVHAPLRFTPERLQAMESDRQWGLQNGVFDASTNQDN